MKAMRKLRVATIVLLAGLCFLTFVGEALACTCGEFRSQKEAFAQSGAVFSGKVLSTRKVERNWKRGDWPWGGDVILMEFEVYTVWKGKIHETTFMVTAAFGGYCGWRPTVGGEYLVYSGDGESTHICERKQGLDYAQEDFDALGEGRAPQPGTSVPHTIALLPPDRDGPAWGYFALVIAVAGLAATGWVFYKKALRGKT